MSVNLLQKSYYRLYQKTFKVAMNVMPWRQPRRLSGPGCIKDLPVLIR